MKTIYLAGPDVFFVDSARHFDQLEALCHEYGFEGLRPSDGGLSAGMGGTGDEVSQRIYDANMALIRRCDAVLANLMPFRGAIEPDSGTVFEVGAAVALGKPVAGYFPGCATHFEQRVVEACGKQPQAPGSAPFDATYGFMVESFQQPLNLMLSRSSALFEDPRAALQHLTKVLSR